MTLEHLYLEAARVARMVKGSELRIADCVKINGVNEGIRPTFFGNPERYEFALAIVEGKPVFKDSPHLFHKEGSNVPVSFIQSNLHKWDWSDFSWNPPKPKTVMVEMLVEDAEYTAGTRCVLRSEVDDINERNLQACRKALKEMKE